MTDTSATGKARCGTLVRLARFTDAGYVESGTHIETGTESQDQYKVNVPSACRKKIWLTHPKLTRSYVISWPTCPLKEKAAISNLDEDKFSYLQ